MESCLPISDPPSVKPVLTVDVEEWFHVCGVAPYSDSASWEGLTPRVVPATGILLDLLAPTASRATFYVVGWVARRHPSLVRRIAEAGHELGCHGDRHLRVDGLPPEAFREELRRGRAALEDAAGVRVTAHRAPEWSIRSTRSSALAILAEEGFETDSSLLPVPPLGEPSNPRRPTLVATKSGPILEVPALVGTLWGRPAMMGGGWTSRLSREGRVAAAIDGALAAGVPPVLYVHPWEVDPEHPPMELPALARFIHFAGLSRVVPRLRRLLARHTFVPVRDVRAALLEADRLRPAGIGAAA